MQSENTAAAYKDESSDSENHDAYLERMKAEGEDKDSEDGTHPHNTHMSTCILHFGYYGYYGCLCSLQKTQTLWPQKVAAMMI